MWLNREIPYKLERSLTHVAKRAIHKAINEFEKKTCIRFRNITGFDQDHLIFISGRGCYSYIGKHGGAQEISVGKNCESVGIVLHLIMHALGYWHEQSRLDRDNYVLIHYDNIAPENKKNFEKFSVKMDLYDYDSITHISPYAFAINKTKKTISSKDERHKVGQRIELSKGDAKAVERRYCGQMADSMTEREILANKRHEEEVHRQNFADIVDNDQEEINNAENGCRDLSKKCRLWATQGKCYKQRQQMITNCPASCLSCDGTTKCKNFNSLCGMWAWMGQCLTGKRSLEILKLCPLACGVCLPEGTVDGSEDTSECTDRHHKCRMWADKGRCFYQHIIGLCPASCNQCGANSGAQQSRPSDFVRCEDSHKNCPQWKQRGRCNEQEIKQKCKKSCNLCSDQPSDSCRDNNPVLCKYLSHTNDVACLLEITAKACPKTCGRCK